MGHIYAVQVLCGLLTDIALMAGMDGNERFLMGFNAGVDLQKSLLSSPGI